MDDSSMESPLEDSPMGNPPWGTPHGEMPHGGSPRTDPACGVSHGKSAMGVPGPIGPKPPIEFRNENGTVAAPKALLSETASSQGSGRQDLEDVLDVIDPPSYGEG